MRTAPCTRSRLSRSQDEFNQFEDMKGLSDFDQPHAFLWTATYRTPSAGAGGNALRRLAADWELSAVTLFKSGTPFSVDSGSDAPGFGNVDGNGGDRQGRARYRVIGAYDWDQPAALEALLALRDPAAKRAP